MNDISQIPQAPVREASSIAVVFSAAQSRITHSAIVHSGIAHSPVMQSKIAQSPVSQTKTFQSELPESEFLNLSFDELSKVAVRAHRSNQMPNAFQTKAALEVKSKENFLDMPLEKLMNLPVRMATLGKNDKDKDKQDTQDVTSNPTSINFQAIPVFSKQALESVSSYQTNTENTSTVSTDTDISTTTTTTTTTTVFPFLPSPAIVPIAPVILPQFLAVSSSGSMIGILLRNSDGSFTSGTSIVLGTSPLGIASADFNNDNILDLLVTYGGISSIGSVLLGTGIGTFGAPTDFPLFLAVRSASPVIADFNMDGILDFATVRSSSTAVDILLGTGTGTFGPANNFTVGLFPGGIAVGDFNLDGIPDLAVSSGNDNIVSILLGTGFGTFNSPIDFAVGASPGGLVVGDFNNDNIPDLAITNFNSNSVSILLGLGNGLFGPQMQFGVGSSPQTITTADFNKDGNLDLATSGTGTTVYVLLGTGTGSFTPGTDVIVGVAPGAIVASDFNGDGNPDIAVAHTGTNSLDIFYGNGNGLFQSPILYPVPSNEIAIGILPAGVSGSPINLALGDSTIGINDIVTLTINGIPPAWSLNAGVNNLDGSWTVQTSTPELLTITTPPDFVGARALEVDMSWVSMDGEIEHVVFKDNIEAYAPGSPIFALPFDNLTGSPQADIFVISKSQPCINDKIFHFDATLDKIDLIDFESVHDFSDLIIQNDTYGNALIQLGSNDHENHSVLLYGIDAGKVIDSNFLFNITPHTINTEKIDIGPGAIMPFYGVFENNGTIQIDGKMIMHGDITGTGKIILGTSGVLELKGHLAQDIIFETSTTPIMFDHIDLTLVS